MKIGTKSVLAGAHCFILHPWFVALAWWRLFGFPYDLRLWFAFFLHDIGYIGKPNMDGPEGETHVELGARIMHFLFDWRKERVWYCGECGVRMCSVSHATLTHPHSGPFTERTRTWYDFCLYHSRYYARKANQPISRLCIADKFAFALTPKWLYLPMVSFTGELSEYLSDKKYNDGRENDNPSEWYDRVATWVTSWAKEQAHAAQSSAQ